MFINLKKTWLKIFEIAIIPVVIAIMGLVLNNTIAITNSEQKYVEIAVSILRDKPSNETKPLREWAANLLQIYAPKKVPITDSLKYFMINNQISVKYLCPDGNLPDWNGNCLPIQEKNK